MLSGLHDVCDYLGKGRGVIRKEAGEDGNRLNYASSPVKQGEWYTQLEMGSTQERF